MGVLSPQQLAERVALKAANVDVQAGKVRDALGRWAPPKVKSPDTGGLVPGPQRGASVLVVAATHDEAAELVRHLRDSVAAEFEAAGTHAALTGRGYDVVVYRPGWRGVKTKTADPHPAADQWRTAIVRTRTVKPGVELYL